ncbi:MAG: hypothetical protein GSR79_05970 [Desulfurococcales archaeon]|nr:hypothetical protein [Desulfurococcales archaeon]
MEHLYNLFWSAIRGKSLKEFERFVTEIKGDYRLYERLNLSPGDVESSLTDIPIQYRFLAFLEELLSALLMELILLEYAIPDDCDKLDRFIRERARLANNLLRDLNQEVVEYNLEPREFLKAKLLLDSYRSLGNGILRICGIM